MIACVSQIARHLSSTNIASAGFEKAFSCRMPQVMNLVQYAPFGNLEFAGDQSPTTSMCSTAIALDPPRSNICPVIFTNLPA
jgi:hypothetical protein